MSRNRVSNYIIVCDFNGKYPEIQYDPVSEEDCKPCITIFTRKHTSTTSYRTKTVAFGKFVKTIKKYAVSHEMKLHDLRIMYYDNIRKEWNDLKHYDLGIYNLDLDQ